jgi:hypothetical protein
MKSRLLLLLSSVVPSLVEGAIVSFPLSEPILFYREEDAPTGEVATPLDIDQNGSTDFQLGGVINYGSLIRPERSNKLLVRSARPPDLGGSLFPLQDNTMVGLTESPMGLIFISTDLTDGFVAPEEEGLFLTLIGCFAPTGCSGPFYVDVRGDPQRSFIGFEIEIEGDEHYGYFDISTGPGSSGAILNGWAYESEPGKAITTAFVPEPSTALLGFLTALTSVFVRVRNTKT